MEIKAVLNGMGSVHKNLLRILEDKKDILSDKYDLTFNIIAVTDSSGVAINQNGYDKLELCTDKENGIPVRDFQGYAGDDLSVALKNIDYDILFEASPVDHKTGGRALEVVKNALMLGSSVVLANKGPVVVAHGELHQLAKDNQAQLKYSATVCGGLPVLNIAERDMIAGEFINIRGVFNGTSNFICDGLLKGMTYEDALKEAQDVGAAEADPSLDVDGWDTAFKLLIIVNSVLGANITLDDIDVTGITDITADMLRAEAARGNTIKLVASAKNGKYSVKPIVLAKSDFLGSCDGWEMAVEIHSDIYGISYHKLYEKEPIPTAASMMRDAVNIFSKN
ncbi:MAG: homoserine dehydrogenase [Kordiimonadaceae bacterium]|jgi:homoserine dehydrogenase|nr:homoserine dehydrogenase [Kordiimonadaceae bacterium]